MMRGLALGAYLLVFAFSACAGDGERRAEPSAAGEGGAEDNSSSGSVSTAGDLAKGGASSNVGGGGDAGGDGVSGSAGARGGSGGAGPTDGGSHADAGATVGGIAGATDAEAGAGGGPATACSTPPPAGGCQEPTITGPQEAYLKAAVVDASSDWGRAIALDGDTLVVGGPNYEVGGLGGAAIVFRRDCNGWHQEAVLTASNRGVGDQFGASVAISGETIVVGAWQDDGSLANPNAIVSTSGAAYVFTRCGAEWTQQAYLKASEPDVDDRFGLSVAVSGDTIVVGAPSEASDSNGVDGDATDDSGLGQGAANVFSRSGGVWTQTAYLKASTSSPYANFGEAVAISGSTILVGADGERSMSKGVNGSEIHDAQGYSAGAAYVFVQSGGSWAQQAYLKSSNTTPYQYFGQFLAVDGDTAVIGAPGESSVLGDPTSTSAVQTGAAYVFTRSQGVWTQQAYLKASNAERKDMFACSVALDGDRILIGAQQESSAASGLDGDQADNTAIGAGAAYLFSRAGVAWTQQTYVKASNSEAGDVFGISVALSGGTFAVSAMFEDSNSPGVNGDQNNNLATRSGAVYVFKP